MHSDYSISQFRFLEHLLLVHGRWTFQRISLLILHSFFRNVGVLRRSPLKNALAQPERRCRAPYISAARTNCR